MPYAAPTPCCHPGCSKTISGRWCDEHKKANWKRIDQNRGTSSQRGYNSQWRSIRLLVLTDEPLCRFCKENKIIKAANVVDHIDGNSRNNNRNNLRALCKRCHDSRTARDQGFGRDHKG